jgi:sarcosine oxidase
VVRGDTLLVSRVAGVESGAKPSDSICVHLRSSAAKSLYDPSMKRDYEYIVLGLGGFGSAAAYWLSRRGGAEVLGLEQFELGHARGESQDHSRIIRLSYHARHYVELAKHAYQAWAELEREAGEQLILRTGGLDFAAHGNSGVMNDCAVSMDAADVPYERLDAAEIMRRWPPFRLTSDMEGLYQEQSGIAMAAKANGTHQRMAVNQGATLRPRTRCEAIRPSKGEVEIVANGTLYRCRHLILTAGAWSNRVLAAFGLQLPLKVTQEQVTYFAAPRPSDFDPDRFPVWIWRGTPSFYGFPIFGEAGPKVGQDGGGKEVTAETRTFDPDLPALRRVQSFLQQRIPSALGPIIYTKSCLYTLMPDRDFVLDQVPGHPEVHVALGGGHGFKFASLIGKILAELAVDGRTEHQLEHFRFDRAVLEQAKPD